MGLALLRSISLVLALSFALRAESVPSSLFVDATESSGLRFQHRASKTERKYLLETMSGGVAIFDFDRDGWMDVFFVNGAELKLPHPAGGQSWSALCKLTLMTPSSTLSYHKSIRKWETRRRRGRRGPDRRS